jgi:glycosyltransferase involved in cell wall biosynthesis
VRIVSYHPRARVGDGGITNSVRRLSEAWARAGDEPVIAFDGHGQPFREDGIEWRPVRHVGPARARLPIRFAATLRSADVLVLNSAWTIGNLTFGAAARRRAVPYVLAPRGAYDPLIVSRGRRRKRAWWLMFERRLVRLAAAVHVFFPDQRHHLEALGYSGPFVVAPNGVSVPEGTVWDGGSGGYVLYLGRFDPEHKGLDLLLRGLATLPEARRPTVHLHGPDWRGGKKAVIDLIARLGLHEHVHVGPPLYGGQKWRALSRAAAFAYPSRWEGFGNSLAEAAVVGVPAMATPYPLALHLAAEGACTVVDPEPAAMGAWLAGVGRARDAATEPCRSVSVRDELGWDAVAGLWLDQLRTILSGGGASVDGMPT